jgi:hypothetical protein
MNTHILMLSLALATVAALSRAGDPPTYRDLIRARQAKIAIPDRMSKDETKRTILSTSATAAVVRVVSATGQVSTQTLKYLTIPRADEVASKVAEADAEAAALSKLVDYLAKQQRVETPLTPADRIKLYRSIMGGK